MPPITIKNLGKFMAKFGEYPEARFGDDFYDVDTPGSTNCHETKLIGVGADVYISITDGECNCCKVIDPRWPEIAGG